VGRLSIAILLVVVLLTSSSITGCADLFRKPIERKLIRADELYSHGQLDGAINAYTEIIRESPGKEEAYFKRGNAYNAKGEHDLAITDYTKAIELDSDYAVANNDRIIAYRYKIERSMTKANELHSQGRLDEAIKAYTEVIRDSPEEEEAYWRRGNAYNAKGEHDLAIADHTKAIELDPDYAIAYNDRGFAYLQKGEYDKTIADCTKAIELDPQWPHAYNNRARAYKEQGRKAEAIADFEKFITLTDNPQWIETARRRIKELSE
jgi:tetratricopeptide (TPR) repeat protein